jgi:hypothetical protein
MTDPDLDRPASSPIADQLHALDQALAAVPVPAGLETRIIAATAVRPARPRVGWQVGSVAIAFAAGVVLAFALAAVRTPATAPAPEHASLPAPSVGPAPAADPAKSITPPEPELEANELGLGLGLQLRDPDCRWSSSPEGLRFAAGCRLHLADPAMDLDVWTTTELSAIDGGLAVRFGELMFVVEPVADAEHPARIGVSGGTIEILGTRFIVAEDGQLGHVDLLSGSIQFRAHDGRLRAVDPGERFRWHATAEAASVAPKTPTTTPAVAHEPDETVAASAGDPLAEGLAEVARLRRSGRLSAAIAKLDELATDLEDPRTLEVIGYERATLVERADPDAACATWAALRRRYPAGRYDDAIARRLAVLACAP